MGHPVTHVYNAFPHKRTTTKGQCNATDEEIAAWCAKTEYTLVTIDAAGYDFNGRWVRSGLLAQHGLEVIVFDRDVKGLVEQHRRVTWHMASWQSELERQPYGQRVWLQDTRMRPQIIVGKPGKQRARSPRPGAPSVSRSAP